MHNSPTPLILQVFFMTRKLVCTSRAKRKISFSINCTIRSDGFVFGDFHAPLCDHRCIIFIRIQLSMLIQSLYRSRTNTQKIVYPQLSLIGWNLITMHVRASLLSRSYIDFPWIALLYILRAPERPTNCENDGNSSETKLKLNQIWNKHKSSTGGKKDENKIYELVWVWPESRRRQSEKRANGDDERTRTAL